MSLSLATPRQPASAPPLDQPLDHPPGHPPPPSLGRREALPGGEAGTARDLAALVHHCTASDSRRDVVWLRLSTLPPGLDRPHHRRLLREPATPPVVPRGRSFHLPNGDLAVVAPPGPGAGIAETTRAALEGALPEVMLGQVLRTMRLPQEAVSVLAALEESLGLRQPPAPPADARPLDPVGLAEAERALRHADVWPLHARQSVCRLIPEEGRLEPVREDVRPIAASVSERLLGGRDASASPALAAHLGDLLAARLLATLLSRRDWQGSPRPLHLPLSLAALSGPAFLHLDAMLPPALKPLLTLGLPALEVLAAPGEVPLLRRFLLARGYRLALEVPEPGLLAAFRPARLGIATLRIPFSPDLPAAPGMLRTVLEDRRTELVLAGCDGAAAIAWGWKMGIRLFQGRAIQHRRG